MPEEMTMQQYAEGARFLKKSMQTPQEIFLKIFLKQTNK